MQRMSVHRVADKRRQKDSAGLLRRGWHIPLARFGYSIFQIIQPLRGFRIMTPSRHRHQKCSE